jgi:HEAT repeat protein
MALVNQRADVPIPVAQPELVVGPPRSGASTVVRGGARVAVTDRKNEAANSRMAALLALDGPTLDELDPYLNDPDPQVRAIALSVLTENTPDGFAGPLGSALGDTDARVRGAAVAGLRELVEILPTTASLMDFADSSDPAVRAAVVDLLRASRAGTAELFGKAVVDLDHRVRISGVHALVSLDDWPALAAAAHDENREVRIAAARGLATIGRGGADTVRALTTDRDPLVRAAALAAPAALGDAQDSTTLTTALDDSAWQVREGAAKGNCIPAGNCAPNYWRGPLGG